MFVGRLVVGVVTFGSWELELVEILSTKMNIKKIDAFFNEQYNDAAKERYIVTTRPIP